MHQPPGEKFFAAAVDHTALAVEALQGGAAANADDAVAAMLVGTRATVRAAKTASRFHMNCPSFQSRWHPRRPVPPFAARG
jgi:hypothetical protein